MSNQVIQKTNFINALTADLITVKLTPNLIMQILGNKIASINGVNTTVGSDDSINVTTVTPGTLTDALNSTTDNLVIIRDRGLVTEKILSITPMQLLNYVANNIANRSGNNGIVYAPKFNATLIRNSGTSGTVVVIAVTPVTGGWPLNPGLSITSSFTGTAAPIVNPIPGTVNPLYLYFTPNGSGNGTFTVASSTGMTTTSGTLNYSLSASTRPSLTMTNAVYASSDISQGLSSGTGVIAVGDMLTQTAWTIEMRAKYSGTPGNGGALFDDNTASTGIGAFGGGQLRGFWKGYTQAINTLNDGLYHHYALTAKQQSDGTYVMNFYTDGVFVSTNTNPNNGFSSGQNLTIAAFSNGGTGIVDSVKVSKTVQYTSNFTPPSYLLPDVATFGLWNFEGNGSSS